MLAPANSRVYAASDFDSRSLSGLSASEIGQEESGDEYAPTSSYQGLASGGSSALRAANARPVTSRAGSGIQGTKSGSRNSAASVPRSHSRQRHSSTTATPRQEVAAFLDRDATDAYGPLDEEDDEVVPQDRGEELVRRRMRARQKEKRRKEKEAEKKMSAAQQRFQKQTAQHSGDSWLNGPSSPRPRQNSALAARAASPTPSNSNDAQFDREGRPTFIHLPRTQLTDPSMLSPVLLGPASSPGPGQVVSLRPALTGAAAGGTYPSPHSHIRRPSAPGGPHFSDRRVSASGPRAGSQIQQRHPQQPTMQQQDVFYDGSDARSSRASSSIIGEAEDNAESVVDDEDAADEGRDQVTDLRGATVLSQHHSDQGRRSDPEQPLEGDEGLVDEIVDDADAAIDEVDDVDVEEGGDDSNEDSSSTGGMDPDDVEYTLKDRQDAINIEHPFGLPIWKPALYKKSRTVTRNAESALHSIPSRAAEGHLLPGNLLWTLVFGLWLSIICALVSLVLRLLPLGGTRYARVAWELSGYLFWPFGKYVEAEISPYTGERSAPARIDGNNRWSFVDQDGGIGEEGEGEGCGTAASRESQMHMTAPTPVAARSPHNREHRVPFDPRSPCPQSRQKVALDTHNTIRPGDVPHSVSREGSEGTGSTGTKQASVVTPRAVSSNSASTVVDAAHKETAPLKDGSNGQASLSYGTINVGYDGDTDQVENGNDDFRVRRELGLYEYVVDEKGRDVGLGGRWFGVIAWGFLFWGVIAPVLGFICLACWAGVVTIPMAKLSWVLLKNLAHRPLALHFGSALEQQEDLSKRQAQQSAMGTATGGNQSGGAAIDAAAKKILLPLKPGQAKVNGPLPADGAAHPLSVRRSKILLCTYRAIGAQYYKYTVGGVNILFVNTLPFVGFTIVDFFFLKPYVERHHIHLGFLAWVSSQSVIFFCALGSVIPLSYFIGMAVASISAQSSIGMGAVINATFGSIIEIILYAIALTQKKARLVEGSIIGSILAGVLLMPGLSMCSGATRRKEQRFNARSAGVTSTMLIMAIIGILTPTLFYQIYGTFQLTCTGCPARPQPGQDWACKRCFYEHVPPATDRFYQENVKGLMYTCTVILVLSYGIGLWFSLRTHASQIWQKPQPAPVQAAVNQLATGSAPAVGPHAQASVPMTADPHQLATVPTPLSVPSAQRASIYKKLLPVSVIQQLLPLASTAGSSHRGASVPGLASAAGVESGSATTSSTGTVRLRNMLDDAEQSAYEPPPLQLPDSFSQEDYVKAMALTATAFQTAIQQHQQEEEQQQQAQVPPSTSNAATQQQRAQSAANTGSRVSNHPGSGSQHQTAAPRSHFDNVALPRGVSVVETEHDGSGGGHDAPSWSRGVSLTVLLSCTVLYAIIAEILVDVVDVVLDGSGIDEKFLGVTLFALVPNTTEFMNAMSFAINGNIALSMEIGSAYALQVCLIQIPAMVAWSAYYNAGDSGDSGLIHRSFTLIFPRWDVIAIVFSVFLLTYTYIEARSNYYRGSICILSYLVLVAGFYFAPASGDVEDPGDEVAEQFLSGAMTAAVGVREHFAAMPFSLWLSALWGALYTR